MRVNSEKICQIILVCSLSSKHFTYIVSPFENTRPTLLESRSRFDDVLSILQANIPRIPRFSRREDCTNKRLTDLLLYSQSKESNHPNRVIRSLFDREPLLSRNIARPTRAIYKNYSSMSKARPHLLHSSPCNRCTTSILPILTLLHTARLSTPSTQQHPDLQSPHLSLLWRDKNTSPTSSV